MASITLDYEENEFERKRDKKLSLMLIALLGSLYLTNFSFVLSNFININYELISKVIKAVPVIATIAVLPTLYYIRYNKPLIALVVLLLFAYACSGITVFNTFYKEYAQYFITVCLPCVIVTASIKDFRFFLVKLKYVSTVFSVFALIILLVKQNSADTDADYFMAYSYSSAILTMALFNDVKLKKHWEAFATVGKILYILSIVLLGARGPLLTIALFLISKNISSPKRSLQYKIFLVLVFCLLVITYDYIFSALNEIAEFFGVKSRTLSSLSNKDISMSGREDFYNFYLGEIISNPWKFRGIASDWNEMGYPHQIFIELSYQFGAVGIFISVIMITEIAYMLFIKKYASSYVQTCDFFFLGIGIFTLLLSNTLWKSLQFWIWLGYMFNPQRGGMQHAASRNQLLQLRQHRYDHASNC